MYIDRVKTLRSLLIVLAIIGTFIAGLSIGTDSSSSSDSALMLIGGMMLVVVLIRPFLGIILLLALLWLTPFYPASGELTINRVIGLAVLGSVMIQKLNRGEKKDFVFSSFDYSFWFFAIVSVMSILGSISGQFRWDDFFDMAMSYLLYWLIINIVDSWPRLRILFLATIICAMAVCIPTILEGIRGDVLATARVSIEGSPNYYAGLFLLASLLLVWLSDHTSASQKPILFLLVLLLVTGIFFTGNRSSIMSLGVVVLVYVALSKRGGIKGYLLPVGLVVFAGFYIASQYLPLVASRSIDFITQSEVILTDAARMQIYKGAFQIFQDHPILGVGLGNAPEYLGIYIGTQISTHNLFLGVAAETGLVGLLGLLAMYYFVLRDLLRIWYSSGRGTLRVEAGFKEKDAFHALILVIGYNIIPFLTHGMTPERSWFVVFAFAVVTLRLISRGKKLTGG